MARRAQVHLYACMVVFVVLVLVSCWCRRPYWEILFEHKDPATEPAAQEVCWTLQTCCLTHTSTHPHTYMVLYRHSQYQVASFVIVSAKLGEGGVAW